MAYEYEGLTEDKYQPIQLPSSKNTRKTVRERVLQNLFAMESGEIGGLPEELQEKMFETGSRRIDDDMRAMAGKIAANYASHGATFTGAAAGAQIENEQGAMKRREDLGLNIALEALAQRNQSRQQALSGLMGYDEMLGADSRAKAERRARSRAAFWGATGELGGAVAKAYGAGGA